MLTRREVLIVGGVGVLAALAGCVETDGPRRDPDILVPPAEFRGRELPIPPVLTRDAAGEFVLVAQSGESELVAGLRTPTWGFNGPMLGPTIRVNRGERVRMRVENQLDTTTTVHWHGMILPAKMDGGPHQPIDAGTAWEPEWTIDQPATTLWYHPHPHGATAEHVYRGLAGMLIVDDPELPDGLPSEYGVDDVPLILQDRLIEEDGTLSFDRVPLFGIMGNTMLVNGAHAPTFTATRRANRFRVLAATNARTFNLAFSDDRTFHIVGNDAGLLAKPVEVDLVRVSPGERIEIVVVLAPDDDVLLQTRAGDLDIDEGNYDLIRIASSSLADAPLALPAALPSTGRIRIPGGALERTFELNGNDAINHEEMSMNRIDTVVARGARELWRVENKADYAHNFHIHGCSFEVVEYLGRTPPAWMSGRKDTVFIPGNMSVLLAVEFADYVDERLPYMYHCHILRHEDKGMMGQFVVVDRNRVDDVPRLIETDYHEH